MTTGAQFRFDWAEPCGGQSGGLPVGEVSGCQDMGIDLDLVVCFLSKTIAFRVLQAGCAVRRVA